MQLYGLVTAQLRSEGGWQQFLSRSSPRDGGFLVLSLCVFQLTFYSNKVFWHFCLFSYVEQCQPQVTIHYYYWYLDTQTALDWQVEPFQAALGSPTMFIFFILPSSKELGIQQCASCYEPESNAGPSLVYSFVCMCMNVTHLGDERTSGLIWKYMGTCSSDIFDRQVYLQSHGPCP